MDLSTIVSFGSIVIGCAVYLVCLFIRKFIKLVAGDAVENNKVYRDLVLPALPVVMGCMCGLLSGLLPIELMGDGARVFDRLLFGGLIGALSGHLYNRVKVFIASGESK